ncbi:MAG: electron transfer flavoprotein subunit alpha/FixB family protein, partial [Planctomycetota bacterium]|nr:electron transfer flavoprotein subunit alpha/FixB family protein [Planctomycetota bacterium]
MSVMAFVEQRNGEFRKSAYEAVSEAKRLSQKLDTEAAAVVVGSNIKAKATELARFGADKIVVADGEPFANFVPEVYTRLVVKAVREIGATVLLVPHTALGRDLAPRVAESLGAAMASDVIQIDVVDGKVKVKRPVYAGKVRAIVSFSSPSVVISLRPKIFAAAELSGAGEMVELKAEANIGSGVKYIVKELKKVAGAKLDLTEADVIVSGGRGMKGPENYKILEELADLLGGVVGASRAAVDAGWRPHSDQVGQTGKTVSPSLYIACGISGAIQHLAGMRSSKVIVA